MDIPKRILVIHVTRIGDTLLTTPVLRALAAAWPEAEITFAGHKKRIEIMRNLPFIHRLQHISKQTAPFMGRLGASRYDLAFVYGQDQALLEYALRVTGKVVAMRQNSDTINRRLFAIAGEDGFKPHHAVTHLLQMLRPFGIPHAGMHLSYHVTDKEDVWARTTLQETDSIGSPLIGLQVASFPTKGFRDWPLEHFVELCKHILANHPNAHFLFFGGQLEASRVRRLHARFARHSTLFSGRLTLRQTAALMNQLDLYIGVDTGPTHIMGALHRSMVCLYHPTSPSRALAPLGHPFCHALDHPMADRGATSETPMSEISVDFVLERVESALSGHFPLPFSTPWTQ